MLKLIGSVMVFGSCAALGLSARQNLRRRVAAADAMLLALGLIRSEISGRRTPMPEIVGLLTENEQPIVRKLSKRWGDPSFEDLLQKGGFYAELYNSQFDEAA